MINWRLSRWIIFLVSARLLLYILNVPSGHDVFGLLMTSAVLFFAWSQLGTRGQLRPFLLGVVLYWFGNLFDWFDGLLHKQGTWGYIVDSLDDMFFAAGFFFIVLAFIRVMREREQLEEQLYSQAYLDELTTLGNRRALFKSLRLGRYNPAGALLFIDINHFKTVNDQYGHETGDMVLRDCADILKQTHEAAYRIGGDEFVLLADRHHPDALCTMLHQHIKPLTTRYDISFSIGVAPFQADLDPDALLAQADQHMYSAKRHFRSDLREDTPDSSSPSVT